jgi:hypothetical protein
MEITDTLSPNPALVNSQSNRSNHQPGYTQVNQGETGQMNTEKTIWENKYFKFVFYCGDNFLCYFLYHRVGDKWEHITTSQTNNKREEDYQFDIKPVKTRTLASIGIH